MKLSIVFLTIFLLISCQTHTTQDQADFVGIQEAYSQGNFTNARMLIDNFLSRDGLISADSSYLKQLRDRMDRILLDFNLSEEQILEQLTLPFPGIKAEHLKAWESSGKLEMRIIDGEKRYFKYAVNNLYRLDSIASLRRDSLYGPRSSKLDEFCLEESTKVVNGTVTKIDWHIQFTVELPVGAVRAGEIVSCWLPFPKTTRRQSNIELLSVNKFDYTLAPDDSDQRSLFLIDTAKADTPLIFQYEARFTSQAEFLDLEAFNYPPYQTNQALYIENTKELPPHVVFTNEVKKLADSLTIGLSEPNDIVRAIYYWINDNIPWASALEYSTFDCIPDYVLKNRHGDCGMVTFLFMSMARYKGIPVKWQSGWMLHPGFKNLHDWAEVYYEGLGWVPLDMSFGLQDSEDKQIKEFYLSGIDAYRMVVNDDIAGKFFPEKLHFRSEPFDFQRGEVETMEQNLYFNQWDYSLKIIDANEN